MDNQYTFNPLSHGGFNAGDAVRVTARLTGHEFELGEIVELIRYYEDDTDAGQWKAEGKNDYWWLSEEEFELVEEGGVEA